MNLPISKDYNTAIQINPEFAEAYNNRGIAYARQNQHFETFADFVHASLLIPNDVSYRQNSDRARQQLLARENSLPRRDRSERRYGYVGTRRRRREGRFQDAIVYFSCAIELNPNVAGYYNLRALSYKNLEQFDKAIDDYDRAIQIDADNPRFLSNRGSAHHMAQHFDQAIADLTKAIDLDASLIAHGSIVAMSI